MILTKMILISLRRKMLRQGMLNAIFEDKEMGKEQRSVDNGLLWQRKPQVM